MHAHKQNKNAMRSIRLPRLLGLASVLPAFALTRSGRGLRVVACGAAVQDAVAVEFAVGDRLSGVAHIRPIDIRAKSLKANSALGCLLDFDCQRLIAPALSIGDLPEIGDRRTDLIGERLALILAQGFKVGVESIHGLNDSICFRLAQAHARKTITFATTANASFLF
jgi:hypothetical protein